MDLRLRATPPHATERAAVDAVLGPPDSGWVGGVRHSENDGHAARGGHDLRSRRHLLLHAVQDRLGWISPEALNYICQRLDIPPAEAYGVASFYTLFSLSPQPPVVAHVCDDLACLTKGAGAICAELERTLGPAGTPEADSRATWHRSPCLGLCEQAPAALILTAGDSPRPLTLLSTIAAEIVTALKRNAATEAVPTFLSQAGDPKLRLLRRIGVVDPT